jgi:hypothetical protein
LKKEIGSSPDEADALAMLYFRDQNRTSLRRTSSEPPRKSKGGFFAT